MLIIGFNIKGFTRLVTNAAYNRVIIAVEGLGVSGVVSLIASLFIKGFKGKVIVAFCDRLKGYYGSLIIVLIVIAFGEVATLLITIRKPILLSYSYWNSANRWPST